jgi:hypothetical protein
VLALGAAFIAYHLLAMLCNGAPSAVREPLWPLFRFYGDTLRLSGRFGVFARFTPASVVVYGVGRDRARVVLAHSAPSQRDAADDRVAKMQRKLLDEAARAAFGRSLLAFHCRSAAAGGATLERVELVIEREGRQQRVLSEPCAGAPK